MDGRHQDVTDPSPATLAGRLWGRFEVLPFRHGMTLLAILVVVPALVVSALVVGDGGRGDRRPERPAAAPMPSHSRASNTAEQAEHTWGEIVVSRSARSTPKRSPSVSPRTSPSARRSSARSSHTTPPSATNCPPGFKKWPWMWDLCKHRRGGHGRP